jgi:hypothetical protein
MGYPRAGDFGHLLIVVARRCKATAANQFYRRAGISLPELAIRASLSILATVNAAATDPSHRFHCIHLLPRRGAMK